MNNEIQKYEEIGINNTIQDTEKMYYNILSLLQLPHNDVLSPMKQRIIAINNLPSLIEELPNKDSAYYISKFIVATANGLFDAALNYLWNETINQLRFRVEQADLEYFYSLVLVDSKKEKYNTAEQLKHIDDATLIDGAKKMELISDLGYNHLNYIRTMRNWASAAHPNNAELTGFNLIDWLELCIKHVISTPVSSVQIITKKFLSNIKNKVLNNTDKDEMVALVSDLSYKNINSIMKGLFGIYVNSDTSQQTINNINMIAPELWAFVTDDVRYDLGMRYAIYSVNGDIDEKNKAHDFLELVNGLSYLPDEVKGPQLKSILDNLIRVHNSMNNFYNEPHVARELYNIVGSHGGISQSLSYAYVISLINVFLTNGSGVAWHAEPIYIDMIKNFNESQAYLAITSFRDDEIKSKLQFGLCKDKFIELLDLVEHNIINPKIKDLRDEIRQNINSLSKQIDQSELMKRIYLLDKNLLSK